MRELSYYVSFLLHLGSDGASIIFECASLVDAFSSECVYDQNDTCCAISYKQFFPFQGHMY